MIKKFNEYINEGVLDKLTGPSEDDVINQLKDRPDRLLNAACNNGMLTGVQYAIDHGAKPNFEHLKKAIENNGNEELLDILINDNTLDENINSKLLMLCVSKDNTYMIKKLVDMGIDIKSDNNAALRICAGLGKYKIAEFLLKLGAKADEDMVILAEAHFYDNIAELLKKHIK